MNERKQWGSLQETQWEMQNTLDTIFAVREMNTISVSGILHSISDVHGQSIQPKLLVGFSDLLVTPNNQDKDAQGE